MSWHMAEHFLETFPIIVSESLCSAILNNLSQGLDEACLTGHFACLSSSPKELGNPDDRELKNERKNKISHDARKETLFYA